MSAVRAYRVRTLGKWLNSARFSLIDRGSAVNLFSDRFHWLEDLHAMQCMVITSSLIIVASLGVIPIDSIDSIGCIV